MRLAVKGGDLWISDAQTVPTLPDVSRKCQEPRLSPDEDAHGRHKRTHVLQPTANGVRNL